MAGGVDFQTAMINRSLQTVKAELEFLADAQVITAAQLSTILSQLPNQNAPHDSVTAPTGQTQSLAAMPSLPHRSSTTSANPPTEEKKQTLPPPTTGYYAQQQEQQAPPPPAYTPTILTHAVALYTYTPTDAGDLALNPHDRIAVTEYTNAEWWKGRNETNGGEGIFPRTYVKVEETAVAPPSKSEAGPSGYGNMPLEVSQSGGGSHGGPSKEAEMGKKFGKKLGNAAIFGAGATMGSKIVNGIF